MASMNVRSGDLVEIITGGAAGKRGKVIVANPKDNTVTVENLNMVTKHKKPRSAQDKGGKIEMPRAIDVSNVMLVCPKCDKATRVAHTPSEDGSTKFVRSCKLCGAVIDAKAKKTTTKTTKKTAKAK